MKKNEINEKWMELQGRIKKHQEREFKNLYVEKDPIERIAEEWERAIRN